MIKINLLPNYSTLLESFTGPDLIYLVFSLGLSESALQASKIVYIVPRDINTVDIYLKRKYLLFYKNYKRNKSSCMKTIS